MQLSDRLDAALVRARLPETTWVAGPVVLPRVGSTNDEAKRLAAQGAVEGTVVVAEEQSAGRGRLGRRWVAPPGTCLLCSILFRPALRLSETVQLTMLCALAAADALQEVAGLHAALKWPNDLLVAGRKLAGLLSESGVTGERVDYVVVGMGINVNVPPQELGRLDSRATSVLAETGRRVERNLLLASLLTGVEERYYQLQAGHSPHAEWAARLATLGRTVTVTAAGGQISGTAEAVDEDGALLVRTPDGTLHRLLAGDVTLRGGEASP